MRKGRIIAVLCLTLILCLVCVTTNTFSWFTRPNAGEGNSFVWNENTYTPNGGKDFTSKTYILGTDGEYTNEVSKFDTTVKAGERVCYKTDIKNNNVKSQTASLYLAGVKSSDYASTYLGVNNPMKTYKPLAADVTSTPVVNEINKKNVYVGLGLPNGYNPKDYQLHYWRGVSSDAGDCTVDFLHKANDSVYGTVYDVYHAQVNYNSTGVALRKGNTWYNDGGKNNGNLNNINFVGFRDNTTKYYKVAGEAAGLENFYSSATVTLGKTLDLSATGMGTLTYSSNSPSVATVDKTTGVVTAKGIGTATITVTSTGVYGDTVSSSCTVTVQNNENKIDHLPVVTNVKIAEGGDTSTESKSNVVSVYWYIKNTSTSDITFSIDKVDVTL